MSPMHRLHVLVCPNCEERIVLPHRNLPGTLGGQYYWPTNALTLTLACPYCAHLSEHRELGIRLEGVEAEAPNLPPSVFWQVAFACDQENCGLLIVVHTRTEADALPDEAASVVWRARPKARCAKGHPLSDNAMVDQVQKDG